MNLRNDHNLNSKVSSTPGTPIYVVNDISFRSIDGRSPDTIHIYICIPTRNSPRRFNVRTKPDGRVDNGNVRDSSR